MSKASPLSLESYRSESSGSTFDMGKIMPTLACAYAAIIWPLLLSDISAGSSDSQGLTWLAQLIRAQNAEPNLPSRIFWPAMAAVTAILAMRNYSRFSRVTWPSHIICLFSYVAFAGASVLWAFKPEAAFIRFAQQMMVLSSIVFPVMLAARTTDSMRGVFLCFAIGTILNLFFVFEYRPSADGYTGYFTGKNYLGEFSGMALLLGLHETLYPGFRRVFGASIAAIAVFLLLWSNSKTAFGLALICPLLAWVVLAIRRATGISPAILLLSVSLCYALVSSVTGFNFSRVSFILTGDSTFTGRAIIWYFADAEIARRPLFGWGYQSFWLVGSGAPSVTDAPGFVANMPNAHNGYYDTMLELGYVGLGFLLAFILATLHAIGRVADHDRGRAWFVLAVALYVIGYNYFESIWMRGFEFLWVAFVILAADVGRYCQAIPLRSAAYGSRRISTPSGRDPLQPARTARFTDTSGGLA